MSARTMDGRFMRRALTLALRGRGTTAPNPMVGAVVVRDGQVVGEGCTQPAGGPHAEVQALSAAGVLAAGASIFVSLEPCNAFGRTPPCVDAIIAAGVRRVVFAASDSNPAMRGGADRLRAAGIEVLGGIEALAALDQNPAFHHQFASDRPFVTLKLARTLDGAITDSRRVPTWLTGPAARREVHRQRAEHAGVAVGVGTAIADDPQLTARTLPRPRTTPARIVFDRTGRLPLDSQLVRTARETPVLLVATHLEAHRRSAFEASGVHVMLADGLEAQLLMLRATGIGSIYCEGGAALADALLDAGLVDRLVIFTAPVRLGANALRPLQSGAHVPVEHAARHRLVSHRRLGDDLMAIYDLTSSVHRTR